MDEALELVAYLPLSFKSPKEEEYIAFLWDAFETNYSNGRYQFAFLAYHMLAMSFVYFSVWQIKQARPGDFEKSLIGFKKEEENTLLGATSPFTLHEINESSVLRFFKLIGCDNAKVGSYIKLVRDRNGVAHSNGNIFYADDVALSRKISEILRAVEEIQHHSKPVIEHCYREFLVDSWDSEERQYQDAEDQVRELLVHANYLSQKDVEICLGFDLTTLPAEVDMAAVNELREVLAREYGVEEMA